MESITFGHYGYILELPAGDTPLNVFGGNLLGMGGLFGARSMVCIYIRVSEYKNVNQYTTGDAVKISVFRMKWRRCCPHAK
jgi:hypothetical protein